MSLVNDEDKCCGFNNIVGINFCGLNGNYSFKDM